MPHCGTKPPFSCRGLSMLCHKVESNFWDGTTSATWLVTATHDLYVALQLTALPSRISWMHHISNTEVTLSSQEYTSLHCHTACQLSLRRYPTQSLRHIVFMHFLLINTLSQTAAEKSTIGSGPNFKLLHRLWWLCRQ